MSAHFVLVLCASLLPVAAPAPTAASAQIRAATPHAWIYRSIASVAREVAAQPSNQPTWAAGAEPAAPPRQRSVKRKIAGALLGGAIGFVGGAYSGGLIAEHYAKPDDDITGLLGAVIGGSLGAAVGAYLGARFF